MIGVPFGFLPVRIVAINEASVYRVPISVVGSGVRFDATL